MTKNDFREELLNSGFSYLYVVSLTDKYKRDVFVCDKRPDCCHEYTKIEWEGDLTEALRDRSLVFDSFMLTVEGKKIEIPITLEDLIIDRIDN